MRNACNYSERKGLIASILSTDVRMYHFSNDFMSINIV